MTLFWALALAEWPHKAAGEGDLTLHGNGLDVDGLASGD
jgi:hypothetical protein